MQTLVKNTKKSRHPHFTEPHIDFLDLGQNYIWDAKKCPKGGAFLRSTLAIDGSQDSLGLLQVDNLRHWLAVGAYHSPYWNGVCYGEDYSAVPKNTHFFLWERLDGSYGILLPLLAGDYVITVRGNGKGIKLHADGGRAEPLKPNAIVAYSATDRNIYQLVNESMHAIAGRFKSFRLRQEKRIPAFADYLGWCTWNACYHDVTAEKILKGVASLKKGGITPGFVLLDDGWQDVRKDKLNSFGINQERFPGGFKPLTMKLKQQYGIKFFGVWHAFQGYWLGVHPQGRLAGKFRLFKERGIIRPWVNNGKKHETVYVVHPRQAQQFFAEYHRTLKREGVEMLKVDVQSGLNEFTEDHFGRASAMQLYQRALQHSAMNHFEGNMIHCMSNTLDVAYNMNRTLVWRNTDDFIPKLKSGGQQEHIRANAINNLLTGTFALPDWDMFQSHHRYAEFHAAARALSGGPVYISDKTGYENFNIIRKVASGDGRVWRCDRPALPSADTIFTDTRKSPALLKIHNRSGNIGLLGFFHCSEKSGKINGSFAPDDVPDIFGEKFIASYYSNGKLEKLSRDEQSEVVLPRMGFEIITLSPIIKSWLAPLGRNDRYIGATSLKQVVVHEDVAEISVQESGEYRVWCAAKPALVKVDGLATRVNYDGKKQLLKVELPVAGKIEIMR